MSRIKSKDTLLEVRVRKEIFKRGYRYKLNYKLPGSPDIVLISKKTAVFVNGCFWHQHGCRKSKLPETNVEFWTQKLLLNKKRDRKNLDKLHKLGWNTYILWECKVSGRKALEKEIDKIQSYLNRISP